VHLVRDSGAEHQIVIRYQGNGHRICVSCTCLRGSAPLAMALRLPAKDAIAAFQAHLDRLAEQR